MRRAVLLLALLSVPTATFAQSTARGGTAEEPARAGATRAPTPAEQRKLADSMKKELSRSDLGLASEKRADGTEIVRLQGRFQSVSVARRDGAKLKTGCASTAAGADAVLSGAQGVK